MRLRGLWLWLDGLLLAAIVAFLAVRVNRLSSTRVAWSAPDFAASALTSTPPPSPLPRAYSAARLPNVTFARSAPVSGLRDSLGEVLEDSWEGLPAYPAMDMADLGSEFLLTFCLTGFEQTDVQVRMQGSVLTVLAERNDTSLERTHRLRRRVQLPEAVAPGTVPLAFWTNGLLRVRVRKTGIQNS